MKIKYVLRIIYCTENRHLHVSLVLAGQDVHHLTQAPLMSPIVTERVFCFEQVGDRRMREGDIGQQSGRRSGLIRAISLSNS